MDSRIRIAYITKNLNINGISTVILNYCKNINKNKFTITILAGSPIADTYCKEFNKIGVEIIELPNKIEKNKKYYWTLFKELSSKKYDQVHIHGNSATLTIELIIACIKGIKVRFVHCHNSTCNHKKIHYLLKPIFNKLCTYGFACSNMAGKWLFTKNNYSIIPNGFDTHKFVFNDKFRNEIRKKLNIDDNQLLIGHVGRFNEQKNHPYLLEIFKHVGKVNKDAILLLVGSGPDFVKIKEMIYSHPYKDRIILYGETNEVEKIYSAMDIFVFPSIYEGLGIVLLEAQISGLKCITSNVIPEEAYITENIVSLNLENPKEWADEIINTKIQDRNNLKNNYENIRQYEIKENVKLLEKYYKNFYTKDGGII